MSSYDTHVLSPNITYPPTIKFRHDYYLFLNERVKADSEWTRK